MNLFFDEKAQKILVVAKEEMFHLKHPYVGSEHLLLAILKDCTLDVTKFLNNYGITYESFRNELVQVVGIGTKESEWFLFTPLLRKIINSAIYYSKDHQKSVTPYSLLVSIFQEGDGVANRILLGMNIDLVELYNQLLSSKQFISLSSKKLMLDDLAVNMVQQSRDGKYDPVIGRDEQVESLIMILLRKNKSNPLLIGDAGVGKTAIVEELARRISQGSVPHKLKDAIIYNLSISVLVAGTKYRGEFEEKLNNIINEIKGNPNIIIFIDEIHTLMGAGGAEGAIDAANILKPYLAREELHVIGATTISEYKKYIENDKALVRRFQKIVIEEPQIKQVLQILKKLRPIYENYHKVKVSNEILNLIIDYSNDCIFFGKQPDKAIDLLDEVCSYVSMIHLHKDDSLLKVEEKIKEIEKKKNHEIILNKFNKALYYKEIELSLRDSYNHLLCTNRNCSIFPSVDAFDVLTTISKKTRIPLKNEFVKKLRHAFSFLKKEIYGQEKAIQDIYQHLKNIDYITKNKTTTFLMVGKSGVGKTFLLDKVCDKVFTEFNCIKINMDEYRDEHAIYKLIGSDSRYSRNYDTALLDILKENPFSIILLDNIDRTHSSIVSFFLDAFDKGFFYNSSNEKIFIKKCIVFMTTNLLSFPFGFSELNRNDDSVISNISNKVDYKIVFRDFDEKDVFMFLKWKCKINTISCSDSELYGIVSQCHFYECGLRQADLLLSSKIYCSS